MMEKELFLIVSFENENNGLNTRNPSTVGKADISPTMREELTCPR